MLRSQIAVASLSVAGDETYSRTFDVASAISSGQVRFRYIPGIRNGTLTFALDALSNGGRLVGRATPATVTLVAGDAVAAILSLVGVGGDDLGTSDDAGDVGVCDRGFHSCSGSCVDSRSLETCGQSCSPCPIDANATESTCDGTSCGLRCATGYHVCGNTCVSETSPNSCNMSCTPCAPPSGGTAICDGTSCNGSCPSDQKLCFGACIPNGMSCDGSCPSGTHYCSGSCFDNTSVNSCGTSCTPCPVPPNATMATCAGGTCGFACNPGYRACGSTCIPVAACCTNADCVQPANGVATCDTGSNTCVIACNSTYTKCGSECIATTACCVNSDCPPPTNGTATCNASHMCAQTCNSPYNTACNTTCVDTTSDISNCGGCGVQCSGQCALSRCIMTLATGQALPQGIAVDSTSVYWLNQASAACNGSLMKVAIGGGAGPITMAGSEGTTGHIAIDSSSVYWDGERCSTGEIEIHRIPKSGGSVAPLGSPPTAFSLVGLVIDSGNVYFTQIGFMSTLGNVWAVPKAGGPVTSLATGSSCGALAVDSAYVYWIDIGNGAIFKTPVAGGTSTQIAVASPDELDSMAADSTNLYWTINSGGNVTKMPTAGGAPANLASGLSYPRGVIVDGTNAYWFNATQGTILKVPVSGGTPAAVVASTAAALAVDGKSLYWTVPGSPNGKVMKATPK